MPEEQRNSNWQIAMPLLLGLSLAVGLLVGMRLQSNMPNVRVQQEGSIEVDALGQGKVEDVIRYIEAKYVDAAKRNELIEEAIEGILDDLDPHSQYFTPEELARVNEHLQGNFDGIGVEFLEIEDTIVIIRPLPGGPSEAVGIIPGDKIVTVEDSLVAGQQMDTQHVIDMLRGSEGSVVNVGIKRAGEKELLPFGITRAKIPSNSLDIAYMLDDRTGYMKINKFSATTSKEFRDALGDLVDNEGMKDLVLDLRGNSGGYLDEATNMLNLLFKEKGKLLVYTEGRKDGRKEKKSSGYMIFPIEDIVILIDEASASASEIVAGAIQDHDRGILIGRRSYGKGLVQEQYRLSGGSALRLTVARYYTPSGRSIQKPYSDLEKYSHDINDRWASGELSDAEKVTVNDSTKFFTDNGHIVYGGGGIIPDIYIPLDTSGLGNETYVYLRQLLPSFAFRYVESNPNFFADKDLPNFLRNFQMTDEMLEALLSYARSQEVSYNEDELASARKRLAHDMKVRMAKQLYGDLGAYTVQNKQDDMVMKALEVLQKPNPLATARRE